MPQVLTSEHGVQHKLMPKWMRPFLPKRFVAITVSKSLCLYRTTDHLDDEQLRVHEGVHAAQFREHGWIGFIVKYCWYFVRYGYWNSPFEIEARNKAGR